MKKTVREIQNKLNTTYGENNWKCGVILYAKELFEAYLAEKGITDPYTPIKHLDESDLRRGASSWLWYSKCGCSLLSPYEICMRLCSPSEMQSTNYGTLPPPTGQSWESFQAKALCEAAELVVQAAKVPLKRQFIA